MIDISFEATIEPPRLVVTELMPYSVASVWLAETEGLYVKQWWAPTDYENLEVDLTLEVGESWRVLQRDPQGNQYAFYGKVESVQPGQSIEFSLVSELYPDSTISVRQDFAPKDGATIVRTTYKFDSEEALNTYLALGGPERLSGASERLDTLLTHLNG